MNINSQAKVILCFGDSNTRGTMPDGIGRYLANERWTGILQDRLGDNYYVIEEGLGGRTTNLEHYDSNKPGRNGYEYFKPCLFTHAPIDLVIIMLGSNDLKISYNRSAKEIAENLKPYLEFTRNFDSKIKILLVSPSYMDSSAAEFTKYEGVYDKSSDQKSKQLSENIIRITQETGVLFFDAASVVTTGADGAHWTLNSHKQFGEEIAVEIERQFL